MEFRVLGPLEVRVDDRPLPLGGTRPRVVLAALLLGRNTVVPVERLISATWGDDPPGTPTAQIQAAVSALRKTLDADRIVTRPPGYLIRVGRGELDLDEFDREVATARRALDEGDEERAAAGLHAALEWWRDDALVDLAELPVHTAAVAVDERRWTAWEERIEADLALRRHAELIPELSALVAKQPLRDRLWSQLIRAQYRSGRRADALETYRRAREVMRDELGLDPAAELAALHRAILAGDPALDPDELPLGSPSRTRPPCPYRALEAYRPGDAASFFGRGAETAAVVARTTSGPVTVVGPSGSGKSSLVLAGVLPALGGTPLVVRPSDAGRVDLALAAAAARVLDGTDTAALADRIAGGHLAEVVDAVLARTGGGRLVVVLDQAEELLTQDDDLVDRVVGALFSSVDRLSVLATLRADHLGEVLARPALSSTLGGSGVFTLGAMGPDQLREVVTAPVADLDGVGFQPGLVDRILDDVGTEPGALALLGLTLTLLWDEQVDGILTHRTYDDLGRVPGAVASHAEGEWRRRDLATDEPVVRRLFGRLVQVRAGGQVTRRVGLRGEFDEPAWRLAERLSATRLLVVSGDAEGARVELAHEALTTHWPRLRGWIDDDLDFHLWRTALRADLERWQRADRDDALLARGSVLADARERLDDRGTELGRDEIDYVRRSARLHRSTGRRGRMLRSGLAAAAVLVLVLGVVFVVQRDRTAAATADADSRALAAESATTVDRDPVHAALMAVAAYDRAPTAEARSALFGRYQDVAGLAAVYTARDVEAGSARAGADGRVVAARTQNADGSPVEVMVWVHDPGRPVRVLHSRPQDPTFDVAADGSAVWVLAGGGIARLDTATGETRTVVRTGWSGYAELALSPDATRVVLLDGPGGGAPYRVRQWRTADGLPSGESTLPDLHTDDVDVRSGPEPGSVLVRSRSAAGFRLDELDLATGGTTPVAAGGSGALAGDGSAVVTCAVAGDEYLFTGVRVADGGPLGRVGMRSPASGSASSCPVFVVGPGGRVVVDAGYRDLRSVDLATGTAVHLDALSRSTGFGSFLTAVSADGSRLLVTGSSWVGLADLSAPTKATPVLRDPDLLDDAGGMVGLSDDGRNLVVSPLVVGGPAASVARPSDYVPPDGAPAVAVGHSGLGADRVADDRIVLHRLPGLEPLATVVLPDGRTTRMFFDLADRLVTRTDSGEISWWDARTGALLHHLELTGPGGGPGSPFVVTPTRDPNLIAVSGGGGPDVTVRRVDDGRVVDTLPVGGDVNFVSFQRSSDYALVSRLTSTEVWDGRTRQRVVGPLTATDGVRQIAAMTSRPGQFVVLDDAGGRWHRTTYQVGDPRPPTSVDLGSGVVPGAASADGDVMLLLWPDGILAGVLRLDPGAWRGELCGVLAGADLTVADRAAHPGIPDRPVCGEPLLN